MSQAITEVTSKILPVLKHYRVRKAGIFGSFSRGEVSQAHDLDLLVDAPSELSLLDMIGMQQELEKCVGRPVDLVEYRLLKPRIKKRALRDEIRIL